MGAPGAVLGLDYGRARIGLALSDELRLIVKPAGFIHRSDDAQAARVIAALAHKESVTALVIGLPIHAGGTPGNGQAGENVAWVRKFIRILGPLVPLPIDTCDERYSSSEAETELREKGLWPAKPGIIDAHAAAIILRRYLAGER